MAIGTYSELQAAVADWLERGDLTARIPSFIALAEAEMNRTLRARRAQSRSTVSISAEFSSLPAGFREMQSVRLLRPGTATWDRVDPLTHDAISGLDGMTGQPRYYAVVGDQLRLYPAPDATYSVELTIAAVVPALSDSAPTNWVLTDHPDAYLYGALKHAAPFLRDSDQLPVWLKLAGDAMAQILAERRQPGGRLRADAALMRRTIYDITRDV
jgi:hypothetical protein